MAEQVNDRCRSYEQWKRSGAVEALCMSAIYPTFIEDRADLHMSVDCLKSGLTKQSQCDWAAKAGGAPSRPPFAESANATAACAVRRGGPSAALGAASVPTAAGLRACMAHKEVLQLRCR